MDDRVWTIFNETIRMELLFSHLYLLYERLFPENISEWKILTREEVSHSAVIRSGRDYCFEEGLFPLAALDPSLDCIQALNNRVVKTMDEYEKDPPPREIAFGLALELEQTSGEFYYGQAIQMKEETFALRLFRNLTQQEMGHVERIRKIIAEHEIRV